MTAVVLDGIVLGLAFGLLGVGMTLVYGLGGVLNLAYGQMVVLAAIVVMLVMEDDVATFLAALVGVLAAAGVAVLLDLTLMRAVYREHGEERTLLGLLLTLGAAFVIAGLLTWRYPSGALFIYIEGDPVSILGVPMAVGSIWASVIALLVAAVLLLFFGLTTFGRGVRSIIQDETGARLVGINPAFVRTVIFAPNSCARRRTRRRPAAPDRRRAGRRARFPAPAPGRGSARGRCRSARRPARSPAGRGSGRAG